MDRGGCFRCRIARGSKSRVVEEVWWASALPKRWVEAAVPKGDGKGGMGDGCGMGRQKGTEGRKGGGQGGMPPRMLVESRGGEELGCGKGWVGLAPGQKWADADDVREDDEEEGLEGMERWKIVRLGKKKGRRDRPAMRGDSLNEGRAEKGRGACATEGQKAGGMRRGESAMASEGVAGVRTARREPLEEGGAADEQLAGGMRRWGSANAVEGEAGGKGKGAARVVAGRGGRGAAVGAGKEDAGKGLLQRLEEEEWGGYGGGSGGDDEEGGIVEAPFEPPLPRRLLAGRLGALEARCERFSDKANDPRREIAEKKLEQTKKELRVAGGRTTRRLFFSLVSGEDRIKRAEREVQEAKEEVRKKEDAVVVAMQEATAAEGVLQGKEVKLQKEKDAHAFRGFQAAAEASQGLGWHAELEEAVHRCGQRLASYGGECESEWNHIAQFVATFAPRTYVSGEDSELGDLRSAEPASTPSATEPEDEAGERDERAWYDSKADDEHELIQKAHAEAATGEQRGQLAESLEKFRSEAEKAAGVVQQVAMEQGLRLADICVEEQKEAEGDGGGGPVVLAIMDATDQPIPSSGDSGCGPVEPKQKRRGREVQVAGGCTGQDVEMEKSSDGRGKGDGDGL